jgi:hypothetical protein
MFPDGVNSLCFGLFSYSSPNWSASAWLIVTVAAPVSTTKLVVTWSLILAVTRKTPPARLRGTSTTPSPTGRVVLGGLELGPADLHCGGVVRRRSACSGTKPVLPDGRETCAQFPPGPCWVKRTSTLGSSGKFHHDRHCRARSLAHSHTRREDLCIRWAGGGLDRNKAM